MDRERLEEIRVIKTHIQSQLEGKNFGTLASKDKDMLIEAMAKILGLIK